MLLPPPPLPGSHPLRPGDIGVFVMLKIKINLITIFQSIGRIIEL